MLASLASVTIEWPFAITYEQQNQNLAQMCLISEWGIIISPVLTLNPHGLADSWQGSHQESCLDSQEQKLVIYEQISRDYGALLLLSAFPSVTLDFCLMGALAQLYLLP